MKRSGEKMYSYVHFEKELTPGYHKEIKLKKHTGEIGDTFIETIFKLLKKVDDGITGKDMEKIIFTPEKEKKWELMPSLRKKVEEKLESSDLDAIISRFANEAFKWYEHILQKDEDNEFFNATGKGELGKGVVNGK
ncbi:MAG: hypothetical protein ACOC34_04165 [Thermotogota bacterium]